MCCLTQTKKQIVVGLLFISTEHLIYRLIYQINYHMKDLEKQIEKAGKDFGEERGIEEEAVFCIYRGFIEGAKSEAAKEYWFAIFEKEQNKIK